MEKLNKAGKAYPKRVTKVETQYGGPIRRFEKLSIKPLQHGQRGFLIKARETDGSLFNIVCKHVGFSFVAGRLDIVPFERPRFAIYFDIEYLSLNDPENVLTKDKG